MPAQTNGHGASQTNGHRSPPHPQNGPRVHLAASLGGHLELLMALQSCFAGFQRVWVTAAGTGADSLREAGDPVLDVPRLNRSRPGTALRNVLGSFIAVAQERPRVVVASGAGSIVAFAAFARLLGARVLFVETMARVTSPSASGRVLSRIADRVLVQWPEMAEVYRESIVCRPARWEDVRENGKRTRGGALVAVGTHRHPFDRLLRMVDDAVEAGAIPPPVLAQTGSSTYTPRHFEARPVLDQGELLKAVESAQYVICHAGSGIISAALRCGHKPLVVARRAGHGEHVDDHQVQIVRKLAELDLIVSVEDEITPNHLAAARRGVRRPADAVNGRSLKGVLRGELVRLSGETDAPVLVPVG